MPYAVRKKPAPLFAAEDEGVVDEDESETRTIEYSPPPYSRSDTPMGLKDGRDVFVLRFETATMLSTGRDIETWVTSKIKSMAATEVVKRTVLGAYYMAVALPL